MKKDTALTILLLIFTIGSIPLLPAAGFSAPDNAVDHSIYADLLKKYIHNSKVNYQGFKNEEDRLDAYLKILETTESTALSRNERFAFYINAYNAWTIKLILTAYPGITSIKELGSWLQSPWKKKICRIDGKLLSLDHLEHKILRPIFKDPRVHFAVNCASKGCPSLRSEPYTGHMLDRQLDNAAQTFINDPQRNYLKNQTLFVSKIFTWFAEDFNDDVVGFISKHASEPLKTQLAAQTGNIKVAYLDYDWSLNGQ